MQIYRDTLNTEIVVAAIEQAVLDFYVAELTLDSTQVLLPGTELIELDDLARLVDIKAILNGLLNDFASWQPGSSKVLDLVLELLSDVILGLVKERVDFSWCLRLLPSGVEFLDAAREMSGNDVFRFAVELWHSIVDSIDFLNESLIDLGED